MHGVQERQHLHGQQQGRQLVDPAPEDYHNPVGSKFALDHDKEIERLVGLMFVLQWIRSQFPVPFIY